MSGKGITKKCTKVELENRIKTVVELQLQGYDTQEIMQYIADKFNLEERMSRYLVSKATHRLIEANSKTIEEYSAIITANYWKIFRKTEKKEDFQVAISALKELAKLRGLDQVTVNHVMHKPEEIADIDDDFIEAEAVKKNVS